MRGKFFQVRSRPRLLPQILVTRMLTRDPFAVACHVPCWLVDDMLCCRIPVHSVCKLGTLLGNSMACVRAILSNFLHRYKMEVPKTKVNRLFLVFSSR